MSTDGAEDTDTPNSAVAANEPTTYEDARRQLEDVVRRLETGGVPLEESLALWERGEALARRCEEWLEGARRRLDRSTDQRPDDGPATAGSSDGQADPNPDPGP